VRITRSVKCGGSRRIIATEWEGFDPEDPNDNEEGDVCP
jgi:hypothetical protein